MKTVNLDKALKSPDIQESRYPMVKHTPAGWPPLKGTSGKTWYQRALNYEYELGKPVLPLSEIEKMNNEGEKDGV